MGIPDKSALHSVIFQILMGIALIAGMALASMSLSVYVTLRAQDDAEAINLAGSLRMQSYRIGYILTHSEYAGDSDPRLALSRERESFSNKLYRSSIAELVDSSSNTPLQSSYQRVVTNWRDNMEPILTDLEAGSSSWVESNRLYSEHLHQYVEDIDYMVTHLQRNTEGKIELLGMTEGVSIFLIIFTVIFFIMKADSNFVIPLRSLLRAAEQVEKGDLAHRISYAGDNELGVLSDTFNKMTESLEDQYRTLEQQVAERTEELRLSNQAIYFLYKTSREIASSPYDQRLLSVFLTDLQKVAGAELINLCVNAQPNYANYELISTTRADNDSCSRDCSECVLSPEQLKVSRGFDLSLELRNREDTYGFLYVRSKPGKRLGAWQLQLLNTVAETLSTAFAVHHSLGQEHRVILHEERSIIARELHDSLAQSLSYMKMETARLKKMIERGFDAQRVSEAIDDLQEGVNAAYKHLRELLVTFRVKLDAPDLRNALEHAVEEFDEMGEAAVSLNYSLDGFPLGPNQDIHVLHILREAMNNAVKHARATHIDLRCSRAPRGDVVFTVEDNGIGLPEDPEKMHHYGLYTMRERAQQLNGRLTFQRPPAGGTRIELRIIHVPDLMRV